jgi:hypothetical protein
VSGDNYHCRKDSHQMVWRKSAENKGGRSIESSANRLRTESIALYGCNVRFSPICLSTKHGRLPRGKFSRRCDRRHPTQSSHSRRCGVSFHRVPACTPLADFVESSLASFQPFGATSCDDNFGAGSFNKPVQVQPCFYTVFKRSNSLPT